MRELHLPACNALRQVRLDTCPALTGVHLRFARGTAVDALTTSLHQLEQQQAPLAALPPPPAPGAHTSIQHTHATSRGGAPHSAALQHSSTTTAAASDQGAVSVQQLVLSGSRIGTPHLHRLACLTHIRALDLSYTVRHLCGAAVHGLA